LKPTSATRPAAIRIGRQTAGRGGKGVTVIVGIPLAGADLEQLCTTLKRKCGCGGTVRGGTIEIQGDHRDRLITELLALGYRDVKKAGG